MTLFALFVTPVIYVYVNVSARVGVVFLLFAVVRGRCRGRCVRGGGGGSGWCWLARPVDGRGRANASLC